MQLESLIQQLLIEQCVRLELFFFVCFNLLYVYVTSYCVSICMSLFYCFGEPKIIFHLSGQ